MQIYQPGRRRNSDNPDKSQSGNNSPIDKALVKQETENVRTESKAQASEEITTTKASTAPTEKRISRYSERRNKNKEQQRKQQQSVGVDVGGLDVVMAKLELDPEK